MQSVVQEATEPVGFAKHYARRARPGYGVCHPDPTRDQWTCPLGTDTPESLAFRWLRRNICAVAGCTLARSGHVEKDFITFDESNLLMTLRARNVDVRSLQREHRLLVIEQRWPPLRGVMTFHATRCSRLRKLAAMRIAMAVLAHLRSLAEIHVLQR